MKILGVVAVIKCQKTDPKSWEKQARHHGHLLEEIHKENVMERKI